MQIHAHANGWAAGVVLLLERYKRTGIINSFDRTDTLETVFAYFADQFFEQLPDRTQDVLLRTAYLPQVTVDLANNLSAVGDSTLLLEELYKQQLFIDRRLGSSGAYQYHALFKLFLQARAKQCLGEANWRALLATTADLLADRKLYEDAMPLYVAIEAWASAVRVILTLAESLLASGRWKTLMQ